MSFSSLFPILVLVFLCSSPLVKASEHQRIDTLGVSKKGQFVAVEEYGYKPARQSYSVSIRILNVWTKQFVGESIKLEVPAKRPHTLNSVRVRAKLMARDELLKFNISG